MKKWYFGVLATSVLMFLIFGYYVTTNPIDQSYFTTPLNLNGTNPLEWIGPGGGPPAFPNPENASQVISVDAIVSHLFAQRNLSKEEKSSLQTWNHLKYLVSNAQGLPNAAEAIKEAGAGWNKLITSVEQEKLQTNGSLSKRGKDKQCPHFLSKMNASELDDNGFKLQVPCGLTQGSSITLIGIPNGLLGNFRIDLTGELLPGEPDPPIILHYNVRLHGDKVTEDPVIVQNTWAIGHDWGAEERCPSLEPEKIKKVDELDQCNGFLGKETNQTVKPNQLGNGKPRKYFPFKQNDLFVATLRVGSEGIQMTVDGKHITSFAFRETLEPWLVSEVRISGDINLISVVASGLPTSEDSEHIIDLDSLKSVPIPPKKVMNLFIGIFSTANNFKRRMAVRRSWMQYPQVRSGQHKNQMVNEELWNEARTYQDIQLMPFVDYYSLITWKTIAICVFGNEVVSAKYIMKTDDDAFVRVDEILNTLQRINTNRGLLYGLINSGSQPHRSPDSKWYISPETEAVFIFVKFCAKFSKIEISQFQEWPHDEYPPFAHGPGYVVSSDIARTVAKKHRIGQLKIFKLEDVSMGIWIDEMKKSGVIVKYEKDERIMNEGCKDGYVVAHYQGPREMLCLWQKIQEKKRAICCGD
ncbi:3-galactosyltransferase [Striga asiatica]|uniref:3-galactosyltransferase n=1 Tax=Striga asiatica TaxID=4170 RepID=A0A5A7Q8W1_STRAF|nr:3-galactosyltransferase [Striga asiatica]